MSESKDRQSITTSLKNAVVPITVLGLIALAVFGFMEYIQPFLANVADSIKEKNLENYYYEKELHDLASDSKDCDQLEELRLELIPIANPDSWVPDRLDQALKIANARYDILC